MAEIAVLDKKMLFENELVEQSQEESIASPQSIKFAVDFCRITLLP